MNRLVVRNLSKNKLCILLQLPNLTKRFERSSSETVKEFVKRLNSKLASDVETVALLDDSGTAIKGNIQLCDALIPNNKFVFNEMIYEIMVDPATIELINIPDTPVTGLFYRFFPINHHLMTVDEKSCHSLFILLKCVII